MCDLPTGNVTVLLTDIEGSTRLWEQDPDVMRLAHARQKAIISECVARNHGKRALEQGEGDSTFSWFYSAPDALAAVTEIQIALHKENWPTPTPLRIRAALHTGAPELGSERYNASPVNRCARLRAIAHGGQSLLSQTTYDLVHALLPEGVRLRDRGLHRLKDLHGPEHVYELTHPDLPSSFPPLLSLESRPNNLPQQVTSFIGREKELAEIRALLEKTRLLTLTGGGGCGKTRLALQAAADLVDGTGDGVWLVELAPLADPSLVPQTVATALGVREEPGKPIQQTILEHLKSKHLLLLMDNCEHLLEACAGIIDAILRNCPKVVILATSREGLGIAGETTYRVPSLSNPGLQEPQSPDNISRYESVRLFVERAEHVAAGFQLTGRNAPALASICRRLDGIPLAIELAAARVRSMTVEEVNHRLDQRFRLLTGGSRAALPRQQTLRSLIDWSYDLLNEKEKRLLCRLSVFSGGWTLEAAEQVCSDPDCLENRKSKIENDEILDLLTSLSDKSLVVADSTGLTTRYRMFETVRHYARDRLLESGGQEPLRHRHLDYFVTLGEEAEPNLKGEDQHDWLERLESEHDNIRAALEWSMEGDPESGLRLAAAVWRFWDLHSHYVEGRSRMAGLLSAAPPALRTADRARVLNGAGALAYQQGDYAAARTLHEEGLGIRRELGDRRGIAVSLNNLGNVSRELGDYVAARTLYEESLELFRELGDRWSTAMTLNNLSNVALDLGDRVAARALCEESLTILRELGDRWAISMLLNNLGNVARDQSDYVAARALYEESLSILRELSDRHGIAGLVSNIGYVAFQQGDLVAARALYEESLAIFAEVGDRQGICSSLEGLAAIHPDRVRSAGIWGTAERLREQINSSIPPNEKPLYEQQVAAARVALGDNAAFDAAWQEGREMKMEQAIELALSNSDEPA